MVICGRLYEVVLKNPASIFRFNNAKQRVSGLKRHILVSETTDSDLKLFDTCLTTINILFVTRTARTLYLFASLLPEKTGPICCYFESRHRTFPVRGVAPRQLDAAGEAVAAPQRSEVEHPAGN